MTQPGRGGKRADVRVLNLRLLWPFLLLLAAFVVFFEFIADVGGSAEPLRAPPQLPVTSSTPTPGTKLPPDPSVALAYPTSSAEATNAQPPVLPSSSLTRIIHGLQDQGAEGPPGRGPLPASRQRAQKGGAPDWRI